MILVYTFGVVEVYVLPSVLLMQCLLYAIPFYSRRTFLSPCTNYIVGSSFLKMIGLLFLLKLYFLKHFSTNHTTVLYVYSFCWYGCMNVIKYFASTLKSLKIVSKYQLHGEFLDFWMMLYYNLHCMCGLCIENIQQCIFIV